MTKAITPTQAVSEHCLTAVFLAIAARTAEAYQCVFRAAQAVSVPDDILMLNETFDAVASCLWLRDKGYADSLMQQVGNDPAE